MANTDPEARRQYQRDYNRRYRAANRDRLIAASKEAYRRRKAEDPEGECAKRTAWRHANLEKVRECNRQWEQANPDKIRAKNLNDRARNPEGYRARYTLNNAVRAGRLERESCELCGSDENVHGHHHDYSQPLDVQWLCAFCHAQHHREKESHHVRR